MYTYIYIYTYVYIHIYTYTYIYIERESHINIPLNINICVILIETNIMTPNQESNGDSNSEMVGRSCFKPSHGRGSTEKDSECLLLDLPSILFLPGCDPQ